MNILEALKEVENGSIIRGKLPSGVFYLLQTTLFPFGEKEIIKICVDAEYMERPEEIKDLATEDTERMPLSAVTSNNYRISSLEEMLHEIQTAWDLENDN